MTTRREVYQEYPFVVVAVIIEKDGKILLVQESQIDRGQWNHPAGWLDKGENPIEAAKREAEEETGLQVEITHLLGIYNFIKDRMFNEDGIDRHMLKLVFVGSAVETEIDKQGRVMLPMFLRKQAKLESGVVLVGQINRLELWAQAIWDEMFNEGPNSVRPALAAAFRHLKR